MSHYGWRVPPSNKRADENYEIVSLRCSFSLNMTTANDVFNHNQITTDIFPSTREHCQESQRQPGMS